MARSRWQTSTVSVFMSRASRTASLSMFDDLSLRKISVTGVAGADAVTFIFSSICFFSEDGSMLCFWKMSVVKLSSPLSMASSMCSGAIVLLDNRDASSLQKANISDTFCENLFIYGFDYFIILPLYLFTFYLFPFKHRAKNYSSAFSSRLLIPFAILFICARRW